LSFIRPVRRPRLAARLAPLLAAVLLALPPPPAALAASAPFDLNGPTLRVGVTRAGRTLPIAQVPGLAVGDGLSIAADLPKGQSARYLLVAAFLRGATNPPPRSWFFQARTWGARDKAGLSLVVPEGARQVLVFLAPATGGDFQSLVDTVRARPGAFVRASQDLNQASLDHARLEAYLSAILRLNQSDPASLKAASPLLARSLAIKLNADCLNRTADTQAACLTQGQDSLVLNVGPGASIVQALSSGSSAELIQELSATPPAGGGYYSPYVASVLDIFHIIGSVHTAQYQYIPALWTQAGDHLALLLNAPPSFHDPKSVLVVALPAVEAAPPPPLHPVDPGAGACLRAPGLVLAAEGAPLVFATAYAHDLALRVEAGEGKSVDLPVRADAGRGGLVVDAAALDPAAFGDTLTGTLRGQWGFDAYVGPRFTLLNPRPGAWRVAEEDARALIAGRDGLIHLRAPAAGCVESVLLRSGSAPPRPLVWKPAGPDGLAVSAALKNVPPGPATLLVQSRGLAAPDTVPVTIYAPASRLEGFVLHAGDDFGVLKGEGLDNVASLDLDGTLFRPRPPAPGDASPLDAGGGLWLSAGGGAPASTLKAGQGVVAKVRLKDGRTLALEVVVAPPRPSVSLIARGVEPGAAADGIRVQLSQADELPHDGRLSFSLHADGATRFSGQDRVEVAAGQEGALATLTTANGGLTLRDDQIAVARLDLGQAFGGSAFGPLRFRLTGAGGASDWRPLGVLVRLPAPRALSCPAPPAPTCRLTGADLFLIDQIASDPGFDPAIQVPAGFPGDTLDVPRPRRRRLYLRLTDDPAVVNVMTFPSPARSTVRD
jgi:hypothetical protein